MLEISLAFQNQLGKLFLGVVLVVVVVVFVLFHLSFLLFLCWKGRIPLFLYHSIKFLVKVFQIIFNILSSFLPPTKAKILFSSFSQKLLSPFSLLLYCNEYSNTQKKIRQIFCQNLVRIFHCNNYFTNCNCRCS